MLQEGEIVVLVKKLDDDWYTGQLGNKTGLFPANHIQVLQPITSQDQRDTVSDPPMTERVSFFVQIRIVMTCL